MLSPGRLLNRSCSQRVTVQVTVCAGNVSFPLSYLTVREHLPGEHTCLLVPSMQARYYLLSGGHCYLHSEGDGRLRIHVFSKTEPPNLGLFPDPPWKVEEGLVFWATFLVRPYIIKNVITAFLNPVLEFLTPQCIWTMTQLHLQKLKMATKSSGTGKNSLWDKFGYLQFGSKIWSLMSCKHNWVFCDVIGYLKTEVSPAPCDKKCCSTHQTLFTHAEGLGMRLHPSLEWFWFCTSHLCITRFVYSLGSFLCHVLPFSVMCSFCWMACPLMHVVPVTCEIICASGAMWFYLEFRTSCPVFVFKQPLLPACMIRLDLVQEDIIPTRTPSHRRGNTALASCAPSCCYTDWARKDSPCPFWGGVSGGNCERRQWKRRVNGQAAHWAAVTCNKKLMGRGWEWAYFWYELTAVLSMTTSSS